MHNRFWPASLAGCCRLFWTAKRRGSNFSV